MNTTPQPINLFEFEDLARERLPKEEYDYIAGGATDEISVDRNRRAYASWALRPRVLRDVSAPDLSTTVLGTKVKLPVLIAPCGGWSACPSTLSRRRLSRDIRRRNPQPKQSHFLRRPHLARCVRQRQLRRRFRIHPRRQWSSLLWGLIAATDRPQWRAFFLLA